MTPTVARRLAELVVDAPPSPVAAGRQAAALCTMDALGAAVGTLRRGYGDDTVRWLGGRPRGDVPVLGSDDPRTAEDAAFALGVLMHVEDFDDSPHTSYFLPALLAEAARSPVGGAAFVRAWVSAYDVWMILVEALRVDRPFNPTSLVGPVAAAAGLASLRGLDVTTTERALVLAAQSSAGVRAAFGTSAKAVDAGRSAAAGVAAVDLAEQGWTAEPALFEAPNGWFAAFGGAPGAEDRARAALAADRDVFPIVGRAPTFKAWPCCARHLGQLAVLESLRGDIGDAVVGGIEAELGFDPEQTAAFRTHPRGPMEARFSVPYVLAAAALDGEITPEAFTQAAFERVTASGLPERVVMTFVPERGGALGTESCRLVVHLDDGRRLEGEQSGAPSLSPAEVGRKFRRNLDGAPAAAVLRWAAALGALDSLDSVGDLVEEIRRDGTHRIREK